MKSILAVVILGFAVGGCASRQQVDPTPTQLSPAAQELPEDLELVSLQVVIGKVTVDKGSAAVAALRREGILLAGLRGGGRSGPIDEGLYHIAVPEHRKQEAIEILKRDAKDKGYRIIWEIP